VIIRVVNEITEDRNKCLNEFQENSEIKKAMQDMKEKYNKYIGILK
jgi:hypothetical protein